MEFQWNKTTKDKMESDRSVLKNAGQYQAWIVEESVSNILLEIMDYIEAAEERKAKAKK